MLIHRPHQPLTGPERSPDFSPADYADIVHAVRHFTGTWSVDRDTDDRGQTSISIIQEGVHDEETVVFLLWHERGRYRAGLGQGDFYANLGAHECVDGAILAVRSAVEGSAAVQTWVEGLHLPRASAG